LEDFLGEYSYAYWSAAVYSYEMIVGMAVWIMVMKDREEMM
jgi:hypothetical protein